ncbi:C-terminal helicase domain-containing protein [Hominiventricola filiformis]|uniref:C-terminal helicase domain-containing protein n=1 Tax=Hominiventricola filiformis TaxID=2885352 RepID=UPI0027E49DD6|nr:C-terminal helicase domain-containing protein [Hominiventricola filiformis]
MLTKLLRLQQFTGGFIQADEGDKPELVFRGKLDALEDILEDYVIEAEKKLVVFCRFRPEIDLIQRLLDRRKIRYCSIYGDIKIDDRGDIVKEFQTNPKVKVFLAQIDTAGLGITLTAADTCVYYSVNFNYAAYSQSLARIHRIGQRNRCTYIHLVVEKTIDETVLKALAKKEDLAKTVVDDWKQFF